MVEKLTKQRGVQVDIKYKKFLEDMKVNVNNIVKEIKEGIEEEDIKGDIDLLFMHLEAMRSDIIIALCCFDDE